MPYRKRKMAKRIRDYVKYTVAELEEYTRTEGSCVKKVRHKIHLNLAPHALTNIKLSVHQFLMEKKIGMYDSKLFGIILDVRNIKILGTDAAIHFGHPNIHLDIEADCYIFQPHVGAVVRGVVKHVSTRQIGVIIYRVFSVSIRLAGRMDQSMELNSEIEFKIKRFELQNLMPFIEGELVAKEVKLGRPIEISSSDDERAKESATLLDTITIDDDIPEQNNLSNGHVEQLSVKEECQEVTLVDLVNDSHKKRKKKTKKRHIEDTEKVVKKEVKIDLDSSS